LRTLKYAADPDAAVRETARVLKLGACSCSTRSINILIFDAVVTTDRRTAASKILIGPEQIAT
jgi:hypothetical protein